MYEDKIEELNKWFEDEERCFDTSFDGETYTVDELDAGDFCHFVRENNHDMIGFPCMVGTSGIWFTKDDLNKARYL